MKPLQVIEDVSPTAALRARSRAGYDKIGPRSYLSRSRALLAAYGPDHVITKLLRKEDLGFYRHLNQADAFRKDTISRCKPHLTTDMLAAEHIEHRGIRDPDVLRVMRSVPRHEFVPAELADAAYDDSPLDIGYRRDDFAALHCRCDDGVARSLEEPSCA